MVLTANLVHFCDKIFYKKLENNWDHKLFRQEILKHLDNQMIILDLGAGSGIFPELNFRGLVKKVVGVDPDQRVLVNPFLDEAYIGCGQSIPMFPDDFFDVVICCNVLEHLEEPYPIFKEIYRVLKPKGLLLTKTPNKYHYVPMIAKLTPNWFHRFFRRVYRIAAKDSFPTHYRVNSGSQQKKIAGKTGFEVLEVQYFEGRPEYLRIHFLIYLVGIIYERLVNLLHLNFLKVVMITTFRKER